MLYPLSYRGGDYFICRSSRNSLKIAAICTFKDALSAACKASRSILAAICSARS